MNVSQCNVLGYVHTVCVCVFVRERKRNTVLTPSDFSEDSTCSEEQGNSIPAVFVFEEGWDKNKKQTSKRNTMRAMHLIPGSHIPVFCKILPLSYDYQTLGVTASNH